jgi:hypothetical protein
MHTGFVFHPYKEDTLSIVDQSEWNSQMLTFVTADTSSYMPPARRKREIIG